MSTQPDYSKRCDRLFRQLREQKLPNLLVTSHHNVTYLTGFTGEDAFLFAQDGAVTILSDARYEEQLQQECPDLPVFIRNATTSMIEASATWLASNLVSSVCVESQSMTLAQWEILKEKTKGASLSSCSGIVERLRERKDAFEIESIERAISIAERAFVSVQAMMTEGMTEKAVADELEYSIRKLGGSGSAFKTIVGVGARAALPHGRPSYQRMEEAPFVLIDWGAKKNGYLSDLTRIVLTDKPPANKPPAKLEKMYRAVLQAQMDAIAAIKPGVLMSQIDAVARKALEKAGLEKRFTHGLGHSFGLEIHESVRLGKGQERPLEAGMVVTVEPGVYIPGFGGVRIEDDVLVTDSGNQVLTSLAKQWDEVLGA